MTARCPGAATASLREFAAESEHVDAWFRRLVKALPTGCREDIQTRTGIPKSTMDDAFQCRHVRPPLVLAVEGLREIRLEFRRDLADDLLRLIGLAAIPRPDETRDASGLLAVNGSLLAAVAAVQERLGEGLADGVVTPAEASQVAAALTETRTRIDVLLAALGLGVAAADEPRDTATLALFGRLAGVGR
ncbi:MAG: hypothetical protein WC969_14875 [Elusimicrobiota bacterium]|jgi:hypothetical protein